MPIVFAEDFSQDTLVSITERYAYSTIGTLTDGNLPEHCFPLQNINDKLSVNVPLFDPLVNSRLELVMGVGGSYGTYSSTAGLSLFGIVLTALNNTVLATVGGLEIRDLTGDILRQSSHWHFILDIVDDKALVTFEVDGTVYMNRAAVTMPLFSNSLHPLGNRPYGMPKYVSSIVLAYDTAPGTMLSGVQFVKRDWVPSNTVDWRFSSQSIVQDTDKQDPFVDTSFIFTNEIPTEEETVDLHVDLGNTPEVLYTTAYVTGAKNYEPGVSVKVGDYVSAIINPDQPAAFPVVGNSFDISIVRGYLADSGLEFLGEETWSYEDLTTAVGMGSRGVAMPNTTPGYDVWLRVRLDGQEMLIPKVPVRYSVSWDHIYAAGLVYGTNDNGLFPTGTPTNQYTTVALGGDTYLVTLLKGADPGIDTYSDSNVYDMPGTQQSEWSRIFYPLVTDDVRMTSYRGQLAARYTAVDLFLRNNAGNGTYSWCQERGNSSSNRVIRGYVGPSLVFSTASSATNTYLGWRPVLRLV